MNSSSIGYHTRLFSDNTKKVVGGSFRGGVDHLVEAYFSVTIKPSGTPVFVDHVGREVTLYISVDPAGTDKGLEALKQWHATQAFQQEVEQQRIQEESDEVQRLLETLPHYEIVRRLKGEKTDDPC